MSYDTQTFWNDGEYVFCRIHREAGEGNVVDLITGKLVRLPIVTQIALQVAASIAHEVSQPIAAPQLSAQPALRWLANDPPNIDEANLVLGRLVEDADRAAGVLGRIRGHIRKAPQQRERVHINASIRGIVDLTRAEAAKSSVLVQATLKDGMLSIDGDRVEPQQLLLNLILNRFEAMNEVSSDARHLKISTSVAGATPDVLVRLKNSGTGLALECIDQIFAAFYTTKSTALGMGLSICRSIIEGSGGQLSAQPNPSRGAIIELRLPAVGLRDAANALAISNLGHLRTH